MNAQLKKIGLTPGRAALVAVLAVVLAAVWGPQLMRLAGGATERPITSSRQRPALQPRPAAPATELATSVVTPSAPTPAERKLVLVSVSEAAAYDPFAAPAWSIAAAQVAQAGEANATAETEHENAVATRFASLREKGVAMIFVSAKGQAAQVGDQTLHVGDRIDGFKVIEIGAAGVVFEPAPNDDTGEADGA